VLVAHALLIDNPSPTREEIVDAIRSGSVDALVVAGEHGDKVVIFQGADHPYRVLIDAISDRTGRPRVLRASAPRRASFALPVSLLATLKDVGRVAICSEVQC